MRIIYCLQILNLCKVKYSWINHFIQWACTDPLTVQLKHLVMFVLFPFGRKQRISMMLFHCNITFQNNPCSHLTFKSSTTHNHWMTYCCRCSPRWHFSYQIMSLCACKGFPMPGDLDKCAVIHFLVQLKRAHLWYSWP